MSSSLDFSTKATSRAVLRETLQHPVTLYSSAVGILGGVATALFDVSLLTSGVAAFGLTVAAGSWAVNYFLRGDAFVSRHIARMQKELDLQRQSLSERLARELEGIEAVKGSEELARAAREHYPMVKRKYDGFETILRDKLSPGEITFARYLGTAEQIYLSVLDNLLEITTLFKSISTIDCDYIERQLAAVEANPKADAADLEEAATLRERRRLLDEQLKKINALITRNEKAMTALDLAATAVSDMRTQKGRASTDLPAAIKDLEDLARRASGYSIE